MESQSLQGSDAVIARVHELLAQRARRERRFAGARVTFALLPSGRNRLAGCRWEFVDGEVEPRGPLNYAEKLRLEEVWLEIDRAEQLLPEFLKAGRLCSFETGWAAAGGAQATYDPCGWEQHSGWPEWRLAVWKLRENDEPEPQLPRGPLAFPGYPSRRDGRDAVHRWIWPYLKDNNSSAPEYFGQALIIIPDTRARFSVSPRLDLTSLPASLTVTVERRAPGIYLKLMGSCASGESVDVEVLNPTSERKLELPRDLLHAEVVLADAQGVILAHARLDAPAPQLGDTVFDDRSGINLAGLQEVTVDHELGRGSFADVWHGQDSIRELAVKLFRPSSEMVTLAHQHATVLAKVTHSNISIVHYVCKARHPESKQMLPGVALELIQGSTLGEFLDTRTCPLPVDEASQLGVCLLAAISHLHSRGIVHGDLHRDNVMIANGQLKVIDVLYRGSLRLASTAGREHRVRVDVHDVVSILEELLLASKIQGPRVAEFVAAGFRPGRSLEDVGIAFQAIVDDVPSRDRENHAVEGLRPEGSSLAAMLAVFLVPVITLAYLSLSPARPELNERPSSQAEPSPFGSDLPERASIWRTTVAPIPTQLAWEDGQDPLEQIRVAIAKREDVRREQESTERARQHQAELRQVRSLIWERLGDPQAHPMSSLPGITQAYRMDNAATVVRQAVNFPELQAMYPTFTFDWSFGTAFLTISSLEGVQLMYFIDYDGGRAQVLRLVGTAAKVREGGAQPVGRIDLDEVASFSGTLEEAATAALADCAQADRLLRKRFAAANSR